MFDTLGQRLGSVFERLKGRATLSADDVDAALRDIRIALLEADVALPVVKQIIESVREKAIGQTALKTVASGQQVVKLVHDVLVTALGSEQQDLKLGPSPAVYLMVGLQGSGKTTTSGKLARFLKDKQRKKVLMASLDVARPAAQEQLRQLGEKTGTDTLSIVPGQKPDAITRRAIETARREGYDILILDSAGRLSIDTELMAEIRAIRDIAQPVETLLVADAMTGQDAVNVAKAFDETVSVTGIILTRIDGDARGGAALSMRAVTGKPIKFLGTGENPTALEPFHPDRIAGRILGMGDIVSLVERAAETVSQADAAKMAEKLKKGRFDFEDMLMQFRQMNKMGGFGALLNMMPGLGKMAGALQNANIDENYLKRQEAIILSMTVEERQKPDLLNASRRRRIAAGSGTSVQDVNRLIKQQMDMQTMMKRMKKMGGMGAMSRMLGLNPSGSADDLPNDADLQALPDLSNIPNPFAGKDTRLPGSLNLPGLGNSPFTGGGLPGLGGFPLSQAGGHGKKDKKQK